MIIVNEGKGLQDLVLIYEMVDVEIELLMRMNVHGVEVRSIFLRVGQLVYLIELLDTSSLEWIVIIPF